MIPRLTGYLAGALVLAAANVFSAPATAQALPSFCKNEDAKFFTQPLSHTIFRVKNHHPLTIVAFGSSSTQGYGASDAAHTYPAQLQKKLQEILGIPVTVHNLGIGGEDISQMVKRLRDVLALNPDLVIWQSGSNRILQRKTPEDVILKLYEAVRRIKASGADVIIMNPQYAPKVLAGGDLVEQMNGALKTVADLRHVNLFNRFALMKSWNDVRRGATFDDFLIADKLHMNDAGYECTGSILAKLIGEAATRDYNENHGITMARKFKMPFEVKKNLNARM